MRKILTSLIVLSAAALPMAPLTAAHAGSGYHVTSTLSHSKIDQGDKVTISGKVIGGPVKGQKVYVTAYEGSDDSDTGTPYDFGTAKLSDAGHYSLTVKPKTGGVYFFTVTKKHSGSVSGDFSKEELRVYRWTALINFYSGGFYNQTGGVSDTSGIKVGGKAYKHEFKLHYASTAGWGTGGYRCDSFRSYVGVSDGSDDEGTYAIHQETGGDLKSGDVFHTVKHFTVPLHDQNLFVDASFNEVATTSSVVILAEPQVHCPVS